MLTRLCKIALFILLFSNSSLFATDYFWVGNAGSWSDLNHWATTSGGATKHTVLPGATDDVFFDVNSFTLINQQVTITFGATCRSMNWTGSTNDPKIYSFFDDLNVHGSIIIPSTVVRDFLGNIRLKGTSGSHIIDLANLPLSASNNEVLFVEGVGGTWTLQSGFTLYRINLTEGTLNTNGQPITASVISSSGSNARSFVLGASSINTDTWDIASATGLSIDAGTSTISTTFGFYGANLTYNNLTINGNVEVRGNNTFNTIAVNEGSTLRLKDGSTQIISNLVSNGTAGNPITIRSTVNGVAATLSKSTGSISVANMRIQDNIATGGATFSAPTGSVDLGNVIGWDITAIEPTTQVTSVQIRKLVVNSIDLQWTNGNGANRIVLARQSGAVTTAPTDLTNYTAGAFGTGSQVGTDNYVVYTGNSDRATITGLTANTVYHFAVYEFNGTGTGANFLTTTPAIRSATTLPSTAVIISNNPVTVCGGTYYDTGGGALYNYSNNESFTQTLTPSTPGSKLRLSFTDFFTSNAEDILKIYDGADINAPLLGSFSEDDVPGVINAKNAEGKLTVSFVSDNLFQSIGWEAAISCFTLEDEPTANIATYGPGTTGNSFSMNIGIKGNGQQRLLLAKQGSAVNFNPVDGTEYEVNSDFGTGTNLGGTGTYAVYKGDDNRITVNNLLPSTVYHFLLVEYNGANTSSNYLIPGVTISTMTASMATEPTTQATDLVLSSKTENSVRLDWNSGNGARRIVVMKEGALVDAIPQDEIYYNATNNFTTSPEISNGNKVVANTTSNNITISGLKSFTTYHLAVFEFNGSSGGITNYLISSPATNSFTTRVAEPTLSATSLTVDSIGFDFLELKWVKGNGQKRLVTFAKSGDAFGRPVDGVTYTANSVFGAGEELVPGGFVVADGDIESVKVTGLTPNTIYEFEVIEYNGSGAEVNYRTTSVAYNYYQTLLYKPTVQASNIVITDVSASAMHISWERGNGAESLVVIKEGIAPVLDLKDSSIYSSRFTDLDNGNYVAYFGDGDELNDGSIVVYNNPSAASVIVKNLDPLKTYHVAVIEYNRPYNGKNFIYYYKTDNPARASATTLAGQNYYWVGGTGSWSDYAAHWAKSSGGSTFHSSEPSSADNVIFDANSLNTDTDTVYFESKASYAKNLDLSAVTKKVVLIAKDDTYCLKELYVFGSLKLANTTSLYIPELFFKSTESGNVIDFGIQQDLWVNGCGSRVVFNGLGGAWTISKPVKMWNLYLARGELTIENSQITIGNFSTDNGFSKLSTLAPLKLNLPNTNVETYIWKGSPNLEVSGGSIEFVSGSNIPILQANNGKYSKIIFGSRSPSSPSITGNATIDSLVLVGPRDITFEAGKKLQLGSIIVEGDSTKVINLKSSISGQAFIIEKNEGSINTNYVNIKDNIATGGAVFTANNGLNLGNVSGWNFVIPKVYSPNIEARVIASKNVLYTGAELKWIKGNGTKRIVVLREAEKSVQLPKNLNRYTANTNFGSGTDLGDDNFVIYNGDGDSTIVTGLAPGKRYTFTIFEYNDWQDSVKYGIQKFATFTITTINTGDILFAQNTVNVSRAAYFDSGGNGQFNFTKRARTSSIQTIAPENSSEKVAVLFSDFNIGFYDTLFVYDGATTNAPLLGKYNSRTIDLNPIVATSPGGQLTFKLSIYGFDTEELSRNGWEAQLFTKGIIAEEPTIQTSELSIASRTFNSITLRMTKGNGSGRIVIAREGQSVEKFPVDGLTTSTEPFGKGVHLGNNNFVVYAGAADSVEISGLSPNKTYHFAVLEFNGTASSVNYLSVDPVRINARTRINAPSNVTTITSVSDITFDKATLNLSLGNGSGRLVLLRKWKPVEYIPIDNAAYNGSAEFGISSTALGDSTHVIFSGGEVNTRSISNLEPLTRYHAKVFEFNSISTNQGNETAYLLSASSTISFVTDGPKLSMKSVQATYCSDDEILVPFEATEGYGSSNVYRLELSDPTGSFAINTVLKDTTISALTGFIKARIPNTITSSDQYRIRIVTTSPISVSDSIRTISVTNVPDIAFTIEGNILTSTVDNNIQWLRDGVAIEGATSKVFEVPNEPGAYAVRVTNGQCFKTSDVYLISSLEEGFVKTINSIYPNPAKDILTIGCEEEGGSFVVFDLQGRVQQQGIFSTSTFTINVEALPAGMYLIRLKTEKSVYQGSFVK